MKFKLAVLCTTLLAVALFAQKKVPDKDQVTHAYPTADSLLIVKHLIAITKTEGFRNYKNVALLDSTAEYIKGVMLQYADTVYFQTFNVQGNTYRNVVARFGHASKDRPLVVVGAHYDVCGKQEGADDNASGVVGLLELARMLHGKYMPHPIELVAYTLEEPPFFRSTDMGSYVHAQSLHQANVPVYGMVALEMIGYFSSEKGSQDYPLKALQMVYGTTGDYIVLAKKFGWSKFVRGFTKGFERHATIKTRNLRAPASIGGIDFSDHRNYWAFQYDALMVTNSAFYRNKNYHQTTDKMETLDIGKMSKVIDAVFMALISSESRLRVQSIKT